MRTSTLTRNLVAGAAALTMSFTFAACDDSSTTIDEGKGSSEETSSTTDTESDSTETDSDTDASESADSDTDTSDTSDTDDDSDDSGDTGGSGEMTAPGSELKIGDTATIPVKNLDDRGVVKVQVTDIEKGSSSDLDGLNFNRDVSKGTPYYIKMKVTGVSGKFNTFSVGGSTDGLVGDQEIAWMSITGDFAPCDSEMFDYDATAGDSIETCVPVLNEATGPVDGVMFTYPDTGYNKLDGDGLTWRE